MATSIHIKILVSILVLTITNCYSQVGIGTTDVNDNALLELDASQTYGGLLPPRVALVRTSTSSPLGGHVQGMTVYNTITRNDVSPGKYYNDGDKWIRIEGSDVVDSISVTEDIFIGGNSFTNIIDLQFTARKENVMVLLTASGLGYTSAMATVHFRIRRRSNSPTENVIIGGTMNKIQVFSSIGFFGGYVSITPWSAAYSSVLTGLTIGKTYTLRVQGKVTGVLGGSAYYGAAVYNETYPDSDHLTVSVIQ